MTKPLEPQEKRRREMGLYQDQAGFGKKGKRITVAERKKIKNKMVQAIVKKLKAAGKPIDLQAINHEVLDKCKRKHQ